jgi:hypothetical protein
MRITSLEVYFHIFVRFNYRFLFGDQVFWYLLTFISSHTTNLTLKTHFYAECVYVFLGIIIINS